MSMRAAPPVHSTGLIDEVTHERRRQIRAIFAQNFGRIIEERGVTQKDVAQKVGIEPYEMSRYARGAQTPKPGKVEVIARALEVDPDALVPGYVTKADAKGMKVTMQELDSGNMWIEFAGAFDRETANEMISIMAKNRVEKAPR